MQDPNDPRQTNAVAIILLLVGSFMLLVYLIAFPFMGKQADAASPKTAPGAFMGYKPLLMALQARQPQVLPVSRDYIEVLNAEISAYTAIETCQGTKCLMSNGKRAYVGAAACPRTIPLGTLVNIQDVGIVSCEDHTATWTEGRFDVFFGYTQSDYVRAKQWGVRVKEVTINHSL